MLGTGGGTDPMTAGAGAVAVAVAVARCRPVTKDAEVVLDSTRTVRQHGRTGNSTQGAQRINEYPDSKDKMFPTRAASAVLLSACGRHRGVLL